MPPRFLLFLVKTNVINANSRVRKIIVLLMSVTCSEKWVCSYSIRIEGKMIMGNDGNRKQRC
jgi:hypothetical protein